jgi:hypothetical protein
MQFRLESLNLTSLSSKKLVVPHVISRSAMFVAGDFRGRHGAPELVLPAAIPAYAPFAMQQVAARQTAGMRLCATDRTVFVHLLSSAYRNESAAVSATIAELLAAVGKRQSGPAEHAILAAINRLAGAAFIVQLDPDAEPIQTELFDSVKIDKKIVNTTLAKGIPALIAPDRFKLADASSERKALSPLALWLLDFYSSHNAEPFPALPDSLRRLSGRDAVRSDKFEVMLADALNEMKVVTGWRWFRLHNGSGKAIVVKKQ